MLSATIQTPTFFAERALAQLLGGIPVEAADRLRANFHAFRAWVAEPAFRAGDGQAAVRHVLESVGPAVQLKVEFAMALAEVPGGLDRFLELAPEIVAAGVPERLVAAADHLARAQRIWLRLFTFHPDRAALEGSARGLPEALTLAFHADNLLTVAQMASETTGVSPRVVDALTDAAISFATRYHAAVRDVADGMAPSPRAQASVADLLALPPYDGTALSVEEIDEAVAGLFQA